MLIIREGQIERSYFPDGFNCYSLFMFLWHLQVHGLCQHVAVLS